MRKLCLTLTATLAVMGAMIGGRSDAAVIDPNALRTAADEFAAVETVQFVWAGHQFCWYDDGWRGPGWYRCGFRLRRGLGWGGPIGWRGWRRPGIGVGVNRPGPGRPGFNRPGANRPAMNRPSGNRPAMNRPGNRPSTTTGAGGAGGNRPGANRPSSTTGAGGPGGGGRGGGPGGGGNRGGNQP